MHNKSTYHFRRAYIKRVASFAFLITTLGACSRADSYNSSSNSSVYETVAERPKTAAELRAELLTQEQGAPSEYLATEGTYRRNFIGQLVLEGRIINRATLARFKDPVLMVEWYSKTNTLLENKEYKVFESVGPQGTAQFKVKTDAPSYVDHVAMAISSADVVE